MKPLKLKIKGLNSFVEEQTIDFEKLTRQGFFGIFGPTGSGKSTILDGMILALYGMRSMSRGTNEFVNKNCKSAQVSYEFQISGKEIKRYRVEREFKANEKGTKSGKCKLVDITNGEIVLEETVSGVDKACADIIGLTADDFMRTVVLPQGKFSEFLKVSGKERREILERLFRLEEYGIKLEERISGALRKENEVWTRLAGQAEVYNDYTDELLREKEIFQKQLEEELLETEKFLKGKKKELEEAIEVWNLQKEEAKKKEILLKLQSQQEEIDVIKSKILLAQRAGQVAAILDSVKELEKTERKLQEQLKTAEDSFVLWKEKLNQYCAEFEKIEQKKELEEGQLIVDISQAKEALTYWRELPELYRQQAENEEERDKSITAGKKLEEQEKELEAKKQELGEKLEFLEKEVLSQIVTSEYREQIGELVRMKDEMGRISDELNEKTEDNTGKELEIKQYEKEINKLLEKEGKLEKQIKEFQEEEKSFKEQAEEIQILRLRKKLEKGVPCPVCGSIHFECNQDDRKESDGDEIKLLEKAEWLKNEITKTQEKLVRVRSDIQLKEQRVEDIKSVVDQQTKKVKMLSEEFYSRLAESQQKMQKLNIENILEEKEKIRQMDLKRENLEKQLREEKPKQMELESAFKSVKEKQEIQKELLAKFESKRNMTEQKIVQKEEEISRKIGTEKEPEAYLKQQEKRLSELRKKYQTAKEQKEQAEMQMRICEDDRNSLEGQIKGNREALFQANEKLCSEMEKQQFSGREEVEYALLEEEVFQRYTEMIETYKKQLHEAEVQLSEIQKKRNRRSITEEKYIECNGICADLEKKTEEQKEKQLEIRQEIRIIRENLDLQKKIVEKLEEVEHKIAILKDLQGVTKGKRFVEFMAVERLKYISKSASKRLFEITNGNYELELNGEGEFVIRDNKNGGVLRQTATLSGGETFVTSLALALALSTEIQLKGTAPLELFFLDEGFGSLDETLLDIVMGSLEKIHNERLKVGIISHVEAVKSRVPVRLIVSPAETGVGGSKVKIEYA